MIDTGHPQNWVGKLGLKTKKVTLRLTQPDALPVSGAFQDCNETMNIPPPPPSTDIICVNVIDLMGKSSYGLLISMLVF